MSELKKIVTNIIISITIILGFSYFGNNQKVSASNTTPKYLRVHNWYTRFNHGFARWHFSLHGAFYAIKKLNSSQWKTQYKYVGSHYVISHGNAKPGWNVFGYDGSEAATYFRYKSMVIDGERMNTFQEFNAPGPGEKGKKYILIYTPNIKDANKIRRIYTNGWVWG